MDFFWTIYDKITGNVDFCKFAKKSPFYKALMNSVNTRKYEAPYWD